MLGGALIMESINKSQLYSVLISVRLFEYICSLDMYCRNQMLGVLLSLVLQVIMIILIFMFKGKFTPLDKILSNKIISWIYVLYFVFYGGVSLNRLTSIDNVIPKTLTGILCIILFGATCIYCAKLGFKALFRSSIAIMFLVVISFIVVIYGVTSSMDISNVYLYNDNYNIFYYTISDFAKNTDLIFLVLLMESSYTRKEAFKYLGFKLLCVEVLSLIGLCVLGGIGVVSEFSFIDLASYSQPFGIQRSDAIYSLITTLICVLNVSLALMLSNKLLSNIFVKHREPILVILMVIVSYLVGSLDINIISAILILVLGCLIPSILNLSSDFDNHIKEGA